MNSFRLSRARYCLFTLIMISFSSIEAASYTEKIHGFLGRLESEGLSAAVLVIDSSGRVARGCGMADRENKRAITPQTLFDIGSVTKQFTGAAIVALVEDGKLSFSDSLAKFWPQIEKGKAGITLHMLLTHSSGFEDAIGDDYDSLDRETFLNRAFSTPLKFSPGERYDYSNVGYSILAAVIEKVSGKSYEAYLRDRLFLRAGMTRTGYTLLNVPDSEIAVGYFDDDRWGRPTEKHWSATAPYWNLLGNGGILSSLEDMEKWYVALRGTAVLSESSKKIYFHRHIQEQPGVPSWYGYGWGMVETPRKTWLVTHNGSNGIFYASVMLYFTEGLSIIVLCNAMDESVRDLSYEIAKHRFIPDYVSELTIQNSSEIIDPQTHAQGRIISYLVETLQSASIEQFSTFIDSAMSSGLREATSLQGHLGMFQQIGSEIKGLEIQHIEKRGGKFIISFANSSVQLVASLQGEKLSNLGVK